MTNLTDVLPNYLITSARTNLINEYIEHGTHRINTLSVDIGGTEVISSTRDATVNSLIVGSLSGILKADNGLVSVAVLGTDYIKDISSFSTDNLPEGSSNLYDKIVILNEGTNITITGSYPEFTINSSGGGSETDEKVKYNVNDLEAGYLEDKTIAGTGITLVENNDRLQIANSDTGSSAVSTHESTYNHNLIATALQSETDPVFTASQASNITSTDITNLGNLSGTNTGDQDLSGYQQTSEKGQNNGYASLDSGGKIPSGQLPSTVMEFKGNWNADTNTPTLADGVGDAGDVYLVSVAGTQNLGSGSITFALGDWILYNGSIWEKSINSNDVVSVNSQQGVVVLDTDDINEGSINLYDKTVSFTGGTNVTISGTYPNFTITDNSINATDLSTALGSYVPYTGATANVDLGEFNLTATNINTKTISFDTAATPVASQPGLLQWNEVDGTLDIGLKNGSVLQSGQELYFYGKATEDILNGELCQFAGVQGDHITIKKAVAGEIAVNPRYLIGVATQNIDTGEFGYVTWFGKVNGVYTKTPDNNDSADWLAGDILYFNNTTGQLTKTEPVAPDTYIVVAVVIKEQSGAAENGVILVRPNSHCSLKDLSDVNGTALDTNGQLVVWDNDNAYFDFTSNINDYVPYTGATNNVDLGSFDLSAGKGNFGDDVTLDEDLRVLSNNFIKHSDFDTFPDSNVIKVFSDSDSNSNINGSLGNLNYNIKAFRSAFEGDFFVKFGSSFSRINYSLASRFILGGIKSNDYLQAFNFGTVGATTFLATGLQPNSSFLNLVNDSGNKVIELNSVTGLDVFGATIDSSGNIAGTNLSGTNTGDQDLSGLVPYSGATANVDLGEFDLSAGKGNFSDDVTVDGDVKIVEDKSVYFADVNGDFNSDEFVKIYKNDIIQDTYAGFQENFIEARKKINSSSSKSGFNNFRYATSFTFAGSPSMWGLDLTENNIYTEGYTHLKASLGTVGLTFTGTLDGRYHPRSAFLNLVDYSGVPRVLINTVTGLDVFGATIDSSGNIAGTNLSGTNTGDQTITLTGNVTGSGTGSFATTIANNAVTTAKIADANVTYAKIQDVSASRLLGRHEATSGDVQEIQIGTGLAFSAGVLNASSAAGSATWGGIGGTIGDQTDLQNELNDKLDKNTAITGATKTKITYDADGLVTAGANATTADIADSSNKRYVTDAQLIVIGNTSGTNTGDQDLSGYVAGTLVTTIGTPGSDTNIPSEQAVREAIVAGGFGDVGGPASSTDNGIVLFDGLTGKLIKDSTKTLSEYFEKAVDDTDDITEGSTNLFDKTVSFTGGTNVTIGGTYPDFTITDNSISNITGEDLTDLADVTITTPTTNQVLRYNGSVWANQTLSITDELVKVSANDTTAGYLNGKLIEGDYITLTETDDGDNETFEIDVDTTALASHLDTLYARLDGAEFTGKIGIKSLLHLNKSTDDDSEITSNAYFDGTNWQRINTAKPAARINMLTDSSGNSTMRFYTAVSGSNPIASWTSQLSINEIGELTATGNVYGLNLSGTNTGDQDLSGYVQGTKVTSIGSPGLDTNIPTEKAVRDVLSSIGGGDVFGPATSTDDNIVTFDGTDSKTIQDSGISISDVVVSSDLSDYAELSGATFTGSISATNLSGTNTGDQTITLTGDVTGTGTGSFATTIANNAVTEAKINAGAVTYAKIQNVSAPSKILGRYTTGAGVVEEITLGANLSLSGGTLNAEGGAGTAAWGGISGTLSDQTDLHTRLEAVKKDNVTFGFTGNTSGLKNFSIASYPFTIKSWRIVSNNSGSVVVDIWKASGAKPTSDAQSICGSEKPTLSASDLASDTDLTTWTTSVSTGDVLGFNIDSISAVNSFTLVLEIEK